MSLARILPVPASGPALVPETLNRFVESLAGSPPAVVAVPFVQAWDR